MKQILSIVTVFLLAAGLLCGAATIGCSLQPLPSVCDSPEPSVLCDAARRGGVQLEDAGLLLMVLNLRLVKEGVYSAQDAAQVFQGIIDALDTPMSAIALRELATGYILDYPELLLVSRYIKLLDTPEILTGKDVAMLKAWCGQNLRAIGY